MYNGSNTQKQTDRGLIKLSEAVKKAKSVHELLRSNLSNECEECEESCESSYGIKNDRPRK